MNETIIVAPEPEPEPAQTETPEAVADAAVEIAQIEADRDVKLAEIEAETRETVAETIAETETEVTRHTNERIAECLTRLDTVATETVRLAEAVSSIEAGMASILSRLTPAEPNRQNQAELENGEVMPASLEAEEVAEAVAVVEPPAEPERKRPASRWI